MKKLFVFLIPLMFSMPIFCQLGNNIVGLYQCIEDEMNLLTREHRYSVKFFEINQINSDSISIWPIANDKVIAKLKDDSLFFTYDNKYSQIFNTHIEGKGSFFQDSINFRYYSSQTGYEAFYIVVSGHKAPTGLPDLVSFNQLKCFPNPFIDQINITYNTPNSTGKVLLNLYSATGLLLRKIEIAENGQFSKTISLEDLNKGIYFGVISLNGNWVDNIKLIKE